MEDKLMPSSRVCTTPYVISVIKQLQPNSILDVGVGFGKWGYLFREYTDIILSQDDPERYQKENWKVRIDGIEAYSAYLHEGHDFIYDKIYEGNAGELMGTLGKYDVIFFGDVIEHFSLEVGRQLIRTALGHSNDCVMLTTPKYDTHQEELSGNPLEKHLSLWTPEEFRLAGPCVIALADRATYVVAYPIAGGRTFQLRREKAWVPESIWCKKIRSIYRPLKSGIKRIFRPAIKG
jgi:hypothetical protein